MRTWPRIAQLLIFVAGLALGFVVSTVWSAYDFASIEHRLAISQEQCDIWRHLAGDLTRERDEAQREAFK